jgi:hypothetical protein
LGIAKSAVYPFAHRGWRVQTFKLATSDSAVNFSVSLITSHLQAPDRTLSAHKRPLFTLSVVQEVANAILSSFFICFYLKRAAFLDAIYRSGIGQSALLIIDYLFRILCSQIQILKPVTTTRSTPPSVNNVVLFQGLFCIFFI